MSPTGAGDYDLTVLDRLVLAFLERLSGRRAGATDDGTATIVEKRLAQAEYRDEGNRYEYVVDVEVPGKPAFRTTMRDPTAVRGYFPPRPGQRVRVMVDVKRQKAKFDRGDPGLDPRNALAAHLRELGALKEQGRIPEAAYELQRKAIIDGTAVIDGRRYGPLNIDAD
jgi:hypothetical protein